MTVRNPIVLIAGQLQELPAGDTVNGASGGTLTQSQTTVDFGLSPVDMASITVATAAITANSMVLLAVDTSGSADHSGDEHLVEEITFSYANIIPGVSFDIVGMCTDQFGLTGQWEVRWTIIG